MNLERHVSNHFFKLQKSQPVEPAASFKVPKASKPQKLPAPVPKVEKPMRKGKSLMPIERDPFDLTLSDVTQPIEKFTRVRNVVTPPQEDEQINRSPSKGKRDSIDLDKVFDAISNDESESNEPKMKKVTIPRY